jgi:hypothetical protein
MSSNPNPVSNNNNNNDNYQQQQEFMDVTGLALFYRFHQDASAFIELDIKQLTFEAKKQFNAWDDSKAYLFHVTSNFQESDWVDVLSKVFQQSHPSWLYLLFTDRCQQVDLRSVSSTNSCREALLSKTNKTIQF